MKKSILILLILSILLLCSNIVMATDFSIGAKSCWDFKTDASDQWGSWDGAVTNAVHKDSYSFTGGGAYFFDGSSMYIDLQTASQFIFTYNTSVLVCANTTDVVGSNAAFGNRDTGHDQYTLLGGVQTGSKFQFEMAQTGIISTTSIIDGKVNCYIATWNQDTDEGKVYINGILNASDTIAYPNPYTPSNTIIGGRQAGDTARYWDGWIGITAYWENVTFSASDVTNLWNVISAGYDCADLVALPSSYSTIIDNYITYDNRNFSENLTYTFDFYCGSGNANYILKVNGTEYNNTFVCNETNQSITQNYIPSQSGVYNISLYFNITPLTPTVKLLEQNVWFDMERPEVTYLNFSIQETINNYSITFEAVCDDDILNNLTYNLSFNNILYWHDNSTNSTTETIEVNNTVNGANTFSAVCSDLFGFGDPDSISNNIFYFNIILIDEKENSFLNLNNVSGARAYIDDNSSYYDFKSNNRSSINFTSLSSSQLRVELVYADGGIITRYVDGTLLTGPIRVCANKEGVTHYSQLVISSTSRKALIKNIFSNCFVGADYTRFAYQDAYSLKYYTIPSLYYLYTYDSNGNEVILASIDGSIQGYNNIDTLEFSQQAYNIDIKNDEITFEKYVGNSTLIYYYNQAQDNTDLSLTITRLDSDTIVFFKDDFTNQNNFTLIFDYSTLNKVNSSTLFKAEVIKTTSNGLETLIRYFNTLGEASNFRIEFAFTIALLLSFFGLTFAISRLTFSWFGIIVEIGAIAVLSLAPSNLYSNFLMAVDVIILIYIAIISTVQNYPTLV